MERVVGLSLLLRSPCEEPASALKETLLQRFRDSEAHGEETRRAQKKASSSPICSLLLHLFVVTSETSEVVSTSLSLYAPVQIQLSSVDAFLMELREVVSFVQQACYCTVKISQLLSAVDPPMGQSMD